MADNTNAPGGISYSPHGPFIYFENVMSFGHMNGIIAVTISAACDRIGPEGSPVPEQVIVASLRGNILAAKALRDALDKALLMAAPTQGDKAN
jgi:hypothetical protein